MQYQDLTPSFDQLNSTIRRERSDVSGRLQSNAGGVTIYGGFNIMAPGTTVQNAEFPEEYQIEYVDNCGLEEVAEWVTDLDASVRDLELGVASGGRENTVSTSQPSSTDGYPNGAYWTQVQSADELVPIGLWRLTNGAWVEQEVPPSTVTPYLNTGLIDTSVLSAQIIRSDQFWTSLNSMPRVGFNDDGFQAYDADGNLTVSLNGVSNTLEGEITSGPWQIAKRDPYYGIFCRAGRELATSRSPGLVMVEAQTESAWPAYFSLRSQLWGGSGFTNAGPDANEDAQAYIQIKSAHLADDVDVREDGRYNFADVQWNNQGVLVRNAYPGDGQSLSLDHSAAQLEWRNTSNAAQLNLQNAAFNLTLSDSYLSTVPLSITGSQYCDKNAAGYVTTPYDSGKLTIDVNDEDDARSEAAYSGTRGSGVVFDKWKTVLTGCHGAAEVQLGRSATGGQADLVFRADRIAQSQVNSPMRFGKVQIGDLNGYRTVTVTIGGSHLSGRGTPHWHIWLQPYDWANQASFATKLVSIDHANGTFTAVIETITRAGTTNCGFYWTAFKVEM